jgi:hypothetical protein
MIVSLDDIKTILNIDTTASDSYLSLTIPACESDYLTIRNADWDVDATGGTEYPVNLTVVIAEMVAYKMFKQKHIGLSDERLGDWNLSFESTAHGYPLSITHQVEKFSKFI